MEERISRLEKKVEELEKKLEEQSKQTTHQYYPNNVLRSEEFERKFGPIQNPIHLKKKKKEDKDREPILKNIEANLGRIIGFAAVALVLISLIIFAIALDSVFIQVLLMYGISTALLILGKKKDYDILLQCGWMATYLSIFLTYGYFKLIPEIMFYLLVLLWVLALYHEQKQKPSFAITGLIGLTIVSFFGASVDKALLGCLAFLILSNLFRSEHKYKKIISSASLIIAGILTTIVIIEVEVAWVILLFIVFSLSYLKEGELVNVIAGTMQAVTILALNDLDIERVEFMVLFIAAAFVLFIVLRKDYEFAHIPNLALLCNLFSYLDELINPDYMYEAIAPYSIDPIPVYSWLLVIALIYAIFTILNHFEENKIYRWTNLTLIVTTMLYIIDDVLYSSIPEIPLVISFILIAVLLARFIFDRKDETLTYIISVVWVILMASADEYMCLVMIVALLIQFMFYYGFEANKYTRILRRIGNGIFIVITLALMESTSLNIYIEYAEKTPVPYEFQLIFFILIGFALLSVTVKECFETNLGTIWIGLKYTGFIWYALSIYDTESFVITLILLVLAIVFIALGFRLNTRPMRLYGLGLTCFSCVKMLLFDSNIENTLEKASALLVAGLLCFVISIIYQKMEQKYLVENEE